MNICRKCWNLTNQKPVIYLVDFCPLTVFGLIFFNKFSISFKRSCNSMRLFLSSSILFKSGSVLRKCLSSLFAHNFQRCSAICSLPYMHLFAENDPCLIPRKWTISEAGSCFACFLL